MLFEELLELKFVPDWVHDRVLEHRVDPIVHPWRINLRLEIMVSNACQDRPPAVQKVSAISIDLGRNVLRLWYGLDLRVGTAEMFAHLHDVLLRRPEDVLKKMVQRPVLLLAGHR
jgi:hypothetical protein